MKKILIVSIAVLLTTTLFSQSPGGIATNLQLWLKADAGISVSGSAVTQWNDQSGNLRHHTQATAGNRPAYIAASDPYLFNHQPTVRFTRANLNWLESSNYSAALTNALYVFVVSRLESSFSTTWYVAYGFNGDDLHAQWYGNNASFYRTGNILAASKTNILYALSSYILPKGTAGGDPAPRISWNGTSTTVTKGSYTVANNTFSVGRDRNGTDYMNGDIAEVIIYTGTSATADITAADLQKIQSYLSLKYGISLDPAGQADYVSSGGTTYWSGAANTGYQNNIIGLGRDDNSALYQKEATSYPDTSVTLFLGTQTALNSSNTSTIASDNSFLVLGDNNLNGRSNYSQPVATSFNNGNSTAELNSISNRIWKTQTTTTGTWTINIGTNNFPYATYVLVSNSNSFVPATTRIYAVTGGAAHGVSISNGEYVSIGSYIQAPGGVLDIRWQYG
jgi:hypothetical protein